MSSLNINTECNVLVFFRLYLMTPPTKKYLIYTVVIALSKCMPNSYTLHRLMDYQQVASVSKAKLQTEFYLLASSRTYIQIRFAPSAVIVRLWNQKSPCMEIKVTQFPRADVMPAITMRISNANMHKLTVGYVMRCSLNLKFWQPRMWSWLNSRKNKRHTQFIAREHAVRKQKHKWQICKQTLHYICHIFSVHCFRQRNLKIAMTCLNHKVTQGKWHMSHGVM